MKKEILFKEKRYEDPKLQKKYETAVKEGLFDKLKEAKEELRKKDFAKMINIKAEKKLFDEPDLDRLVKKIRKSHAYDKVKL